MPLRAAGYHGGSAVKLDRSRVVSAPFVCKYANRCSILPCMHRTIAWHADQQAHHERTIYRRSRRGRGEMPTKFALPSAQSWNTCLT
jgi:hypothetical protein